MSSQQEINPDSLGRLNEVEDLATWETEERGNTARFQSFRKYLSTSWHRTSIVSRRLPLLVERLNMVLGR